MFINQRNQLRPRFYLDKNEQPSGEICSQMSIILKTSLKLKKYTDTHTSGESNEQSVRYICRQAWYPLVLVLSFSALYQTFVLSHNETKR